MPIAVPNPSPSTGDLRNLFNEAVINASANRGQPGKLGKSDTGAVYYNDGTTDHKDRIWVRYGSDFQVLALAKPVRSGVPDEPGIGCVIEIRQGTVYLIDWDDTAVPPPAGGATEWYYWLPPTMFRAYTPPDPDYITSTEGLIENGLFTWEFPDPTGLAAGAEAWVSTGWSPGLVIPNGVTGTVYVANKSGVSGTAYIQWGMRAHDSADPLSVGATGLPSGQGFITMSGSLAPRVYAQTSNRHQTPAGDGPEVYATVVVRRVYDNDSYGEAVSFLGLLLKVD